MPKPNSVWRIAFSVGAVVVVLALCLHASVWRRTGAVNWPMMANMAGLFLLMAVGALEPTSRRVRVFLNSTAALLIIPSAAYIWFEWISK